MAGGTATVNDWQTVEPNDWQPVAPASDVAPATPKKWYQPGVGNTGPLHAPSPDAPVMGGPILPEGQIIPSAVGYGVSAVGEHMGLPPWVTVPAGIIAGGLTGAGGHIASRIMEATPAARESALESIPLMGRVIRAYRALGEPAEAPAPVRPNPAVAAKMRFGGSAEAPEGPAYSRVGMSGAPQPETAPEPSFQPVKPNPAIASRIRFGGSFEAPSANPGYGRVGMSGAPAPPPVAPEPRPAVMPPVRPNPNIARNIRYGGPATPESGSAGPAATLGSRAEMMRQIRLKQAAQSVAPPPVER